MPALMRVTDPEIQKIQDHLRGLCPLGTASGDQLYASNCAGCHGDAGQGDGNGRPDIRCTVPSRVSNALRKGRGKVVAVMPSWGTSSLTDAELTSIRAFVNPGANTGTALFTSNCSTCRGATGSGGRNANDVAGPNIRCKSAAQVSDAVVDGFGGMPALPDLTAGQTSAIVTFLRTGHLVKGAARGALTPSAARRTRGASARAPSPRSSAGSPKASTRATCRTQRLCWRSYGRGVITPLSRSCC